MQKRVDFIKGDFLPSKFHPIAGKLHVSNTISDQFCSDQHKIFLFRPCSMYPQLTEPLNFWEFPIA